MVVQVFILSFWNKQQILSYNAVAAVVCCFHFCCFDVLLLLFVGALMTADAVDNTGQQNFMEFFLDFYFY